MIERAVLTAGIVVVIIGALASLGNLATRLEQSVACAFSPETCAVSGNTETAADTATDLDKN